MEGGMGIVAYGTLASLVRSDLLGMDSAGLERWTFMTLSRCEGYLITVLVGYNPCRTSTVHSSSSYQLQQAYFTMAEKDTTCPRRRFQWISYPY
jgi:hypothetical protein